MPVPSAAHRTTHCSFATEGFCSTMLYRESTLSSPERTRYGSWHGRPFRPCSSRHPAFFCAAVIREV